MADSLGIATVVAVGVGSVWGTPVACAQFVPVMSFDDSGVQYARVEDGVLGGTAYQRASDQGGLNAPLTLGTRFRYQLADVMLQSFFGALATGTYTYLDSLTGKFLTLAILRGGETTVGANDALVTEYSSVKVTGMTITSTVAEGTTAEYRLLARNFTDASSTNTEATLLPLVDNTSDNCLHQNWVIWIGDQADALTGSDVFVPSEWTLTLDRVMDSTILSQFIEEPVVDGFSTGNMSLTIPRLTNLQFRTWWLADTALQARWQATRGGRTKTFFFPQIKVNTWTGNVDGPSHIPQTIDLMIEKGVWAMSAQADISVSTTDDSFNDASSGFPLTFPGAKLYASGFTNAGNNGVFTVVSWTTAKIVVVQNLVTETAPASANLRCENPAVICTET